MGTELELVGVYDNSAENPRNPNSPPAAFGSAPPAPMR